MRYYTVNRTYFSAQLAYRQETWFKCYICIEKTLCEFKFNAQSYLFIKLPFVFGCHSLLWHRLRFESAACLLVADGTRWRQRVSHSFFLN